MSPVVGGVGGGRSVEIPPPAEESRERGPGKAGPRPRGGWEAGACAELRPRPALLGGSEEVRAAQDTGPLPFVFLPEGRGVGE